MSKSGAEAQMGAATRGGLKNSAVLAPSSPPGAVQTDIAGNTSARAYEEGDVEQVEGMRNVANQGVYRRRGNVWVAANATHLDPQADRDKIRVVRRFSDEYFRLVRANTVAENQIMASQQAEEKLLIELRGQAYMIE
jgi:hypothetical protein